jgi:hypothetical protein
MDLTRLKVGNTERADDRLSIDDIACVDSSSRLFGRRGLCRSMIRRESNRCRSAEGGCEHEIATIGAWLTCHVQILSIR